MIDREELLKSIKPQVVSWIDEILGSRSAQGSIVSGARYAPSPHNVAGAHHVENGLTAGQVLRATGASSFQWGALQSTDMPNPLKSNNYVPNASGWALYQDGTAELYNVFVRGMMRVGTVSTGEVASMGGTLVVMEGHPLMADVTSI